MAGLRKILDKHNIILKNYDIFIETGLFDGENLSSLFLNGYFDGVESVYSIELNFQFIENVKNKYPHLINDKIKIVQGDSGFLLNDILKKNSPKKILLWLDAHYSSGDTSKSQHFGECPIFGEIEAINNLKIKPTIIIDDLGCFMNKTEFYYDGWPDLETILQECQKIFDFEVFISERDVSNGLHYCILS